MRKEKRIINVAYFFLNWGPSELALKSSKIFGEWNWILLFYESIKLFHFSSDLIIPPIPLCVYSQPKYNFHNRFPIPLNLSWIVYTSNSWMREENLKCFTLLFFKQRKKIWGIKEQRKKGINKKFLIVFNFSHVEERNSLLCLMLFGWWMLIYTRSSSIVTSP